jgi:transposase
LKTDDSRGNKVVEMVTKLVTGVARALSFHYTIFLEDTIYMTILTRQERETLVLDLYNQGKTIREVAKEARMSFRDIGAILNKVVEEKTERLKEDNNGAEKSQQEEEQQQQLSLSTQAYKLFSKGKTPLEVTIELNLTESEATKFCREYWKLKQLHNLSMVYEEIKDDIASFLKLFKLAKAKGIGVRHVVDILAIANNDLPAVQKRFKRLRNEISMLQFQKSIDERSLYQLKNQIVSTTKLLNSLRMSCIRERREIEYLYNEKTRLKALVTGFKSNNEDYLNKIKQAAEEKVISVLTNGKLLLQFALASVIESLRSNSELYNFISYSTSVETASTTYGSNYPSLMLSGRQYQQQSFNDSYTALILEESEKLYNKLTTELTNRVIAAASAIRESSLSTLPANITRQKLTNKNDTYETE